MLPEQDSKKRGDLWYLGMGYYYLKWFGDIFSLMLISKLGLKFWLKPIWNINYFIRWLKPTAMKLNRLFNSRLL